jgi:hypothetical protein
MKRSQWQRALLSALTLAVLVVMPLFAQAQSGNIYGTVRDDKGAPLPGVTITVSGAGAPVVQLSDSQGQFRILGLSPGTYQLDGSLEGFSPIVHPSVIVGVGRNTSLELTMNAAISETITITTESPLLDARKISTGATVTQTELEKIPTARDPWVILQSTPGVLVDRVNVGGNESGQQSMYTGGGDTGTNTSWSVDGVEITDVGAIGSSPSYYDFSAFEELQVTTGGSDTTQRVGGVGMNMVTKRGTNEWRGSGRYLIDKDSWQSSFDPDAGDFGKAGTWNRNSAQPSFSQGNQIVEVLDYGAELGGPIVADKVWVWGSYGKQEVDLLTVDNFSDFTDLETWNAKFNFQAAQNNSAMAFFSSNDKVKIGRNASPSRPQPTTWNQAGEADEPNLFAFFSERPTIAKIEDTHIFASNFFLTGMYAESDGGFGLHPQGGFDATMGLNLPSLAWSGTFLDFVSFRPQDQYKLDGSYFFSTGSLNHELKFGAGYRQAEVRSTTTWPQNRELVYTGYGSLYAYAYADGVLNYEVEYQNLYVQDTLTTGNLTVNVGVRYDDQAGTLLPGFANAPRNLLFQAALPGYAQAGGDPGFDDWTDISPRLGLTYAIGEEKKTLLRASYARFVDQLSGFSTFSQVYPIYPAPYVYFYSYDYSTGNHNGVTEPDELGPLAGWSPNYNPNDPSQLVRSRAVDPNLSAPYSDQLILGIEHSLLPEFVVGLTGTYRENSDLLVNTELVFDGDPYSAANINSIGRRATRDDFVVNNTYDVTLPDGKTTTVQTYGLRPGVFSRGGTILENSDRGQTYTSMAVTANKRLSNNWMMRGNISWNDWEWDVPSSAIINPQQGPAGGNQDGDRVITCAGTGSGAKGNVCISSAWSYSVNGMYQVAPDKAWGFNVAAAVNGHEGYAQPYFLFRAKRSGFLNTTNTNVLAVDDPDDYKLDDVHVLDVRLEKEFRFDRVGLTLGFDVFNALNENTVLQRQRRISGDRPDTATNPDVSSTQADWVYEVLSPRILRIGATLSFN